MLSALPRWLTQDALPLWAERGFDRGADLFRERLTLTGEPLAVPHRAMVQARQIYVYSHAALLGWSDCGAERADRAMRRLRRSYAATSDGETSLAFSIDAASGAEVSSVRDAYTHAFVLLAAAFLYRVTGDPALTAFCDEVCLFIERRLTEAGVPGVIDSLSPEGRLTRRQNPQMHLLEAYLALEEAMPGRGHLERARGVVALLHDRLFDAERGVLLEHYDADWGPHPDQERGAIFEPGHHYEWVWLLEQFDRITGSQTAPVRAALWTTAQTGGHARDGLIYDEVGADGRVVSMAHRLWPHTEAIKAAAVRNRAGDAKARAVGERMAALLTTDYLGVPFTGGWIDHLAPDRTPRVGYVPASSLYHIFLATLEAESGFANPASGAAVGGRTGDPTPVH